MHACRRSRILARVVAVAVIAAATVGCGVGASDVISDDAQVAASDVAATSPASPSPVTVPSSTSAPASSAPPTEADTTPSVDGGLPAQAPAEHGGQAVALYLAITDQGFASPAIEQAQAAAGELGYEVGAGSLGCDQGAAEALGYETGSGQTWATVALYFATVDEAQTVRAAAEDGGHPVEGVAEVTTYCLD